MDKVNNSSASEPTLLTDIIRARANIKQKYNALKTGRFETETLINNTFSTIIDPLSKIQRNTERYPTKTTLPPSPPSSQLPDAGSIVNRSPPILQSSALSSYRDLNDHYGPWTKAGLDKIYGPRKLSNGVFELGDKEIKFVDNAIHIEGDTQTYPVTDGLIDLLFAKFPASKKYTRTDLNAYKSILIQTSAHKTSDGARIRKSKGEKFKIISKLFPCKRDNNNIITGAGINIRLQKHNIIYWNDPNELVNRLRLLYSSLAAGNTGVRNEIISICEELVEAKILKKIPNV